MVAVLKDGSIETFADSISTGGVQLLTANTCDGTDLGTITDVELRAYGKTSDNGVHVYLRPVFAGGDGDDTNTGLTDSGSNVWGDYIDITSDTNAPVWAWSDVVALDCDILKFDGAAPLPCQVGKVEIRVTYLKT